MESSQRRRGPIAAGRAALRFLSSLELTTGTLLYLFVLILVATLYQNGHSIHETTSRFIYAWFFFLGPIPLPAGQLVFTVIGVNLIAGTATRIPLRLDRIGIIIVHLALILLVVGGLFVRLVVDESILALAEGESDTYSYDLKRWDLVVEGAGGAPNANEAPVSDGDRFRHPLESLPAAVAGLPVEVLKRFGDASVRRDGPQNIESVAGWKDIVPADVRRDNPVPGVTLRIDERTILLHGSDPSAFSLDENLSIRLLPRRYPLPATVRLEEFEAEFFEGTQTPRSFQSRVNVLDGDIERSATISMNEPLRLGPYTFFQLGYDSRDTGREISLLHVVRNPVRQLPYVVGLLISFGLILHSVIRVLERKRKTPGDRTT